MRSSMVTNRKPAPEANTAGSRRRRDGKKLSLLGRTLRTSSSRQEQSTNRHGKTKNNDKQPNTFRVIIPAGLREGDEFHAFVGDQVVRVKCPPNAQPKSTITIKVPRHATNNSSRKDKELHTEADSPGVLKLNSTKGEPDAYMVEIPVGVGGGEKFPVRIKGRSLLVTCPRQAVPGMQVRVTPPPVEDETSEPSDSSDDTGRMNGSGRNNTATTRKGHQRAESPDDFDTQLFEVELPSHVRPGHPFALKAGGIRVLVNCPVNGYPGQRIRFRLPVALFADTQQKASDTAAQRLKYDKDGWSRTVRITDQQFQWVRMDHFGGIDDLHFRTTRFDPDKSAFCRKLHFIDGSDHRVRDALLELVPAHEATCGSIVRNEQGKAVVTYPDLAEVQARSFEEKAKWLTEKCEELQVEWDSGHIHIVVRREYLVQDSIDAIMSLNRRDLRKVWRFEFIGEAGLDAGGLTREWFQLVTSALMDPDFGFWLPSEANQICLTINPASRLLHKDYLMYYRFLGRIMGKALFNHQLVAGHMAQFIYKHILGWPITFNDLEAFDAGYHMSLTQIRNLVKRGEDVETTLCMDFTTTVDMMGVKENIDLIPNGSAIPVTNKNYFEYMEVCLRYWMMDRVKAQLNQLLLGFFDVIPEPLLTVFDFQELELLMCGLPRIDLADWMEHTEYGGLVETIGAEHLVCQWFWEVVYTFDHEMKARLLQFVTGTSGVPARGFGVLQGSDGSVRKFTINGVPVDVCLYPRAHTCFNRLDLPMYDTRAEMEEKLNLAVRMYASGFDLE